MNSTTTWLEDCRLLALLVVRVVSQRKLIRLFQIPGLILMPFIFGYAAVNSLNL